MRFFYKKIIFIRIRLALKTCCHLLKTCRPPKKFFLCFKRIFFFCSTIKGKRKSKEAGFGRQQMFILFIMLQHTRWKILTVRDDNRNKMKLFSDRPTLLQNLGLGVDKSTFFKASLTSLKIKNIIRMMGHFFMSPPLSIDIMYNYIFSLTFKSL